MKQVIFQRSEYNYTVLKPHIFDLMDALGKNDIRKGKKVLIKPNFLSPARPDKGILTHPSILKAVCEYCLDKGVRPTVSDSPAVGLFETILRVGGYKKHLEELDIRVEEFKKSVKVNIGEPFGSIDIAREAVEADIVVNLPKLKTHSQMVLTLGVKNLFGCVVGFKKSQWHLKCGEDRNTFAKLLVLIHQAVNPTLTIVDGILGLEGNGPGMGGVPRNIGVLVAGNDAHYVDAAICRMLMIPKERLLTHLAARQMGLVDEAENIHGDFFEIPDYDIPELGALSVKSPVMRRLMRTHLLQRPAVDNRRCKICGECWKFCPAKAITPGKDNIIFDYDACIRCYCCVEICPHGALSAVEPLAGKMIGKISAMVSKL